LFTIEFDEDETLITIIDTTGELEDTSALLYEDYCHLRQWDERLQRFHVITMTPDMYFKLMSAWQLPQGSYMLNKDVKTTS
jgi:hypothetical protein